jgi:transcriptional regulator with XRE-family HTH domain
MLDEVGKVIRERRKSLKLTQGELGKRCRVSKITIPKLEKNSTPTLESGRSIESAAV